MATLNKTFSLLAQIPAPSTAPAPDLWGKYAWDIVTMTGLLLLVCVIIVVVLRILLPRLMAFGPLHQKGFFKVVARFPLEPKKFLYVIKVGEAHQLIATTDHQVTFLTTLSAQDVALLNCASSEGVSLSSVMTKNFAQLLSGKKDENPSKG